MQLLLLNEFKVDNMVNIKMQCAAKKMDTVIQI